MRGDGHVELAAGALVDGGRLRILEDLAEGAMSAVYLAQEVSGGRQVALKVLGGKYAVRADARPRLLAEQTYTQLLAGHPGIVEVLYAGTLPEAEGAPYLALEYVDGPTLDGYCVSRRDDTRVLLELLRQLAALVANVHGAGIIHRDIKPRNVLVADPDGSPTLRLTDFGLATRVDGVDDDGRLTGDHDRPGTKHYMAPEQCTSNNVGTAADVYALGVTAYELLVGDTPWGERTELDVVRRKCDPHLPGFSIAALSLGFPDCVVAAIDAALEYAADRRPSAAAFRDAMDEGLRALELAAAGRTEVVPALAAAPRVVRAGRQRIDEVVVSPGPQTAARMRERGFNRRWLWVGAAVVLLGIAARFVITVPPGLPSEAVREQTPAPAALVNTSAADSPPRALDERGDVPSTAERTPAVATQPDPKPPAKPPLGVEPVAAPGVSAAAQAASTAECAAVRSAAVAAESDGAYARVLGHARRKECWADKRAHKRLVVMAFAQTNQFERCASAGKSSSDPEVHALAKACAARLAEGSQQ